VAWYDWVMVAAVIYGAAAILFGFALGRVIGNAEKERIAQEALREADASRAARLRELGRVTDVREDASGPPATVRRMTVLGKSPRHRPSTRM
jgi:hypothetical protein